MKFQSFIYIFFLIVISACSSENEENDNSETVDTVAVIEESIPQIDKTKPSDSIADLFAGNWISSYYLKKIKDSASIYLNRNYESSLLGFKLDKEGVATGDAWIITNSTNNQTSDRPIRWNYDDSSFVSLDSPTIKIYINRPGSIIYQYSNGNKAYFRKVRDRESALRKTLFSGTYTNDEGKEFIFNTDGTVKGFKGKEHYSLLNNFSEELEFDAVFISSNKDRDNELIYHYEISGDTLRLYDLAGMYPEMGIGAVAHELIKK
ncbi:hypothetical protein OO013_05365 [Mangrovivirga sp. M17]|uniref:Lipocalin-like domain-containing protein n=1 Tax=Mangrovivirga halotolerans TaxID=2993936 RepID=A0ABT3RN98_9BACT|nr:hypothetical protein [Mangrovivirga halotolerans]MCX2743282.1 hypothetical protein [Mangrovivirga halotolerans]